MLGRGAPSSGASRASDWPESPIAETMDRCDGAAAVLSECSTPRDTEHFDDSLLASHSKAASTPRTAATPSALPPGKPITPPGVCPPGSGRRTPARRRRDLSVSSMADPTATQLACALPAGQDRVGKFGSTMSQVLEMCAQDLERWSGKTCSATRALSSSSARSAAEVAMSWMRAGCEDLHEDARSPISSSTLALLASACGSSATARLWHMPEKETHVAPACLASTDTPIVGAHLLDMQTARTAQQIRKICPVLLITPSDAPLDSCGTTPEGQTAIYAALRSLDADLGPHQMEIMGEDRKRPPSRQMGDYVLEVLLPVESFDATIVGGGGGASLDVSLGGAGASLATPSAAARDLPPGMPLSLHAPLLLGLCATVPVSGEGCMPVCIRCVCSRRPILFTAYLPCFVSCYLRRNGAWYDFGFGV